MTLPVIREIEIPFSRRTIVGVTHIASWSSTICPLKPRNLSPGLARLYAYASVAFILTKSQSIKDPDLCDTVGGLEADGLVVDDYRQDCRSREVPKLEVDVDWDT